MVSINFSSDIVSKVRLRSMKVVDYGKRRELSASMKQRLKLWLQPKSYKYITITAVTIMWAPTISHLLENTRMVIKMSDNRSPGMSRNKSDLMIISLPADKRFSVEIPLAISVPTIELSKGLPISFSIVLSSGQAKTGIEIGTFKISASVLGEKASTITVVNEPVVSYDDDRLNVDCETYWFGKKSEASKEGPMSVLIDSYLRGSGTMESLASAMCDLMKV